MRRPIAIVRCLPPKHRILATSHGMNWNIRALIEGSLEVKTSDNLDRWKSRGRKSQRGEENKIGDQRRKSVRRKMMQAREKVEKLQCSLFFFQRFVAPEGRKVGSLKQREPCCTSLWLEAHVQVKKLKAPQARTTFKNFDVENVRAVAARSTSKYTKHTPHLRSTFGS